MGFEFLDFDQFYFDVLSKSPVHCVLCFVVNAVFRATSLSYLFSVVFREEFVFAAARFVCHSGRN